MKKKTISAKYLEQQKQLHKDPDYGNNAALYAPQVVLYSYQFGAKTLSGEGIRGVAVILITVVPQRSN
jgi:hypothetical protein